MVRGAAGGMYERLAGQLGGGGGRGVRLEDLDVLELLEGEDVHGDGSEEDDSLLDEEDLDTEGED